MKFRLEGNSLCPKVLEVQSPELIFCPMLSETIFYEHDLLGNVALSNEGSYHLNDDTYKH